MKLCVNFVDSYSNSTLCSIRGFTGKCEFAFEISNPHFKRLRWSITAVLLPFWHKSWSTAAVVMMRNLFKIRAVNLGRWFFYKRQSLFVSCTFCNLFVLASSSSWAFFFKCSSLSTHQAFIYKIKMLEGSSFSTQATAGSSRSSATSDFFPTPAHEESPIAGWFNELNSFRTND